MATHNIAGVGIPDSQIAFEATELIRDTTNELLFNHSRRVFLFGTLQANAKGLQPDPELLYVSALFHDTGLVAPYRTTTQRFEIDGADQARDFLLRHDIPSAAANVAWVAIALHTTPGIPEHLDPVTAATAAGVETDVLGLHLATIGDQEMAQILRAHPRPDFKNRILDAFKRGFADRPDSTFGTMNADVLEHFSPGFHRIDFVDLITESAWAS